MEHNTDTSAKTSKDRKPRCDDRTTINAILFVLVTGCRWTELPAMYGSKSTAHRRFQDIQQKGTWKKILSGIIETAHKQDKICSGEILCRVKEWIP